MGSREDAEALARQVAERLAEQQAADALVEAERLRAAAERAAEDQRRRVQQGLDAAAEARRRAGGG